ncbi:DUF262 domain-containing protein [Thermodesulfobacteriota bacterium]
MTNYADRIRPTDYSIHTYLDNLRQKNYQIPTFQREIVWEKENTKKMWDSIYKFYPLGSILVWKTDTKLQQHRHIGGHDIAGDFSRTEFQYILDGQQRTTALFTSLYGGKIEGKEGFDPTLYIDLSVEDEDEVDDESFRKRFLFWDEIDDRGGELKANIGKNKRHQEGLIVKLQDVMLKMGEIDEVLHKAGYAEYNHPYRVQLRKFKQILDNYRISFIELRDIIVSEVCQIFERINQAGRPLSIFDIVVAKTFIPKTNGKEGFYLRTLIDGFRDGMDGEFKNVDDLTFLQILSVLIRKKLPEAGILNITDTYLNHIKAEHIETVWPEAKRSLLKLFDFFENHLHIKGPQLVPFRYFLMTLSTYFYENNSVNYDFLKKYFWHNSFHNSDLLSNTTQLREHIDFLDKEKSEGTPQFERFLIDRQKLRSSSYSSRGRLSRAILCLFTNQEPRDWANPDRRIISEVYYLLTDKPNLHHIFPLNFVATHPGQNKLDSNSLMNIAYLTQITNLQISDDNPIDYLKEYDSPAFERIMKTHFMPEKILDWCRSAIMPGNALDLFIEKRIDLIIDTLKQKLSGIKFEVIDTMEQTELSQSE